MGRAPIRVRTARYPRLRGASSAVQQYRLAGQYAASPLPARPANPQANGGQRVRIVGWAQAAPPSSGWRGPAAASNTDDITNDGYQLNAPRS